MAAGVARIGILLINLGTPDSPRVADVRRYLREFLSDPRVLDMNPIARALLLHGLILRVRPRRSAAAYAKVWMEQGSPLVVHGRELAGRLAATLGEGFAVELGMRYGRPSIATALERLKEEAVSRIVFLPLFPQYASSTTESALERAYALARRGWPVEALQTVEPFYAEPGFIRALACVSRPALDAFRPDHVLMSYHGLPERQIRKSDPTGRHCLESPSCCEAIGAANRSCYRAQCVATSRALAGALELGPDAYDVAFQSRLGRARWIEPHTDRMLPDLAARGVRRLAVLCPSFVTDCLETLEEIGIRGRDQWRELGGEELGLVPCLNAEPAWVETIAAWVRQRAQGEEP